MKDRLIELRHNGATWQSCAQQLTTPVNELRALSAKLRDTGEWKLPNGCIARGATELGLGDRPTGRPKTLPKDGVSTRLAPDMLVALHEIAELNEIPLYRIVGEALYRTEPNLVFRSRPLIQVARRSMLRPLRVPLLPNAYRTVSQSLDNPCAHVQKACEQFLLRNGYTWKAEL